jgi:hypothetical protein
MPAVVQCYKCGTQNQLGMRFCISCGDKFAYNCPQCSNFVEPGYSHCSNCGVKLDWGTGIQQAIAPPAEIPLPGSTKELVKGRQEIRTRNAQKRFNPWLIAFVAVLLLIVAIVVFDSIV